MKLLFLLSAAIFAASASPFRSDEKMIFEPIAKSPVTMIGRHMSFIGLIYLPQSSIPETQNLSVYEFEKPKDPLNVVSCAKLVSEILFIQPEFPIRIARTEVIEGRFGRACEVVVTDDDPNAKERRVFVSQIRSKLYAILALFPKGSDYSTAEELRRSFLSFR